MGTCWQWRCLLVGLEPKLAEAKLKVALEVVKFDALMSGNGALAAQTCAVSFLWLTDLVQHPLFDTHAFRGLYSAWPSPVTELPAAVAQSLYGATLPPLEQELLTGGEDNVLLSNYLSLCRETAAVFLGQMMACECPSLGSFNDFTQASLDCRRKFSWSIPTEESLRGIVALGPLLEVGCGTGYWASLLRSRGADIKCFNSSAWVSDYNDQESGEMGQCGLTEKETFCEVLEGGVEVIQQHPDRTLILMWPDYYGRGSFGLKCLEAYEGDYLVIVGEWQGRTFGSYSAGLQEHGQSFSKCFQEEVSAAYCEHEVFRLPNWPLFADCVVVYKRKSLEDLMRQQDTAAGGQDLVSAFFSGAHDPFAALGLLGDESEVESGSEAEIAEAAAGVTRFGDGGAGGGGHSAGPAGGGEGRLDVDSILRSSES